MDEYQRKLISVLNSIDRSLKSLVEEGGNRGSIGGTLNSLVQELRRK